LHALLALNQLVYAILKFKDFTRNGAGGRGPEYSTPKSSREHRRAKK